MSPDDYHALTDCPGRLNLPKDALVVGIFKEGKIVGRTTLVNLLHLEGTWVSPEERGGMIGARLVAEAEKEVKEIGCSGLMAYTADKKHGEYMKRLGYKEVPVQVWGKEFQCQP